MSNNNSFASQSVVGVSNAAEIGEVICARRKELGYTQERFSSIVGLSPRLICEIEHGKATTGIQKIMDIIMLLEIDCIFTIRDRW